MMKKIIAILGLFMGVFSICCITTQAAELDEFMAEIEPVNDDVVVDEETETPAIEEITETAFDVLKKITKTEAITYIATLCGLTMVDVIALLIAIIWFIKKKIEKEELELAHKEELSEQEQKHLDELKALKDQVEKLGNALCKRVDDLDVDRKKEAEEKAKKYADALDEVTALLNKSE